MLFEVMELLLDHGRYSLELHLGCELDDDDAPIRRRLPLGLDGYRRSLWQVPSREGLSWYSIAAPRNTQLHQCANGSILETTTSSGNVSVSGKQDHTTSTHTNDFQLVRFGSDWTAESKMRGQRVSQWLRDEVRTREAQAGPSLRAVVSILRTTDGHAKGLHIAKRASQEIHAPRGLSSKPEGDLLYCCLCAVMIASAY